MAKIGRVRIPKYLGHGWSYGIDFGDDILFGSMMFVYGIIE